MRLAPRSFFFLLAAWPVLAQQDRITAPIDPTRTVVLSGNRNFHAIPQYDRGAVASDQNLNGITLVFKRTASQQAALDQLLVELQDPTSPNYHNWLTPEEFSARFGLSAADYAKVTGWLRAEGFTVTYDSRSRTYVTCSGTAGQVQGALRTALHQYQVDGETHFANSTDPSIPAALEPAVLLIRGLDDFRPKPPRHTLTPVANFTNNNTGAHSLLPGDISTIYDITPIYQKGITGSGQKIAVMGQTNLKLSDIATFRADIGLSANNPQMVLVPGQTDPGIIGDQIEATLDLEYSGSIAQNASVLFVYSPNVETSVEYAIDQNIAPVITYSYGFCEPEISSSPSNATAYRALAQQANAQGITWLASSGDTGAAECDNGVQVATHGLAVEIPSSIPEVTAVGGTEFNEGVGTYWSTTNNSTTGASALGYIPEMAWNDTITSLEGGGGFSSTGGGVSIFFPKPAWQAGTGVPNDGARDVPDLSFSAANDHDPYIIVLNGAVSYVGGTSVSTPIFAGVITLLNQYLILNNTQTRPGLGNINPTLYGLAQSPANLVFHDVTVGNNIIPCKPGTPNCPGNTMGYSAGAGYDLTTGLGSADINNLFTHWPGQAGQAAGAVVTSTTVTASPASVAISGTTVLTATVTAASGGVAPNGPVSFNLGTKALGSVNLTGSGSVGTASLTMYGSELAAGANSITVLYGGSTNFKYSSSSVTVTVSVPTTASAVIPSITPNPVYQQAPVGNCSFFFTVSLTEIAGVATTLTDFTFGSPPNNDYAGSITIFFGSNAIPARGSLSAALCASVQTVPSTINLGFSGRDASGLTWTQAVAVEFDPGQVSASMSMASLPGTEVENPNGDPRCGAGYPFFQELNLQEQNGYEVYLTKFLAGGYDESSSIAGWFGTLRLAPLGALQAGLCWGSGTSGTLSFEIDGVDSGGNTITTTASVPFSQPSSQSGGALSSSLSSVSLVPNSQGSAGASVGVRISSGQVWSASLFPNNQKTNWLVVYPESGTGAGTVNLVASSAGLSAGVYTATLVLQSVNTIPQFVNVPITFTIGGSGNISISSLGNGASFAQAFAPGEILSAFGTNLSNTNITGSTVPLAFSLGGVSASINGIPAPLYGVYESGSSGQINLQIPYEIPAGRAVLAINNNGAVATYYFTVSLSNPGIFVTYPTGLLTPIGTIAPGGSLEFFITGEGDVSPFVTTGTTPTGVAITTPPVPRQPLVLTVGGVTVTPLFVGVPSWSIGVTQVNFTVPANMPAGKQPVVVTVGGVASATAYLNVQPGSNPAIVTTSAAAAEGQRPAMVVSGIPRPNPADEAPRLFAAWQAAIPNAAGPTARLFDLLVTSGTTPVPADAGAKERRQQ